MNGELSEDTKLMCDLSKKEAATYSPYVTDCFCRRQAKHPTGRNCRSVNRGLRRKTYITAPRYHGMNSLCP